MTQFVTFDGVDALMAGLADAVSNDLRAALARKGSVCLAVPGGTTPAPFFEILSNADLDWGRVYVMLSDERYVPETSDRSNTSLIKRHLLKNNASAAKMVSFYDETLSPDEFVTQNGAKLAEVLPIDVCIIGMGTDMHTASLFPDSPELADALNTDLPLHVVHPESQPEARLTLSGPVLSASQKAYVLIVGEDKKQAYEQAVAQTSPMVAPIRVMFGETTSIFWSDKT